MVENLSQLTQAGELMIVARKIWIEAMKKNNGQEGSFNFVMTSDTVADNLMRRGEIIIHYNSRNQDGKLMFSERLGEAPVDLVIDLRIYERNRASHEESLVIDNRYWFFLREVEKEVRKTHLIKNAKKHQPDKSDLDILLKIIQNSKPAPTV